MGVTSPMMNPTEINADKLKIEIPLHTFGVLLMNTLRLWGRLKPGAEYSREAQLRLLKEALEQDHPPRNLHELEARLLALLKRHPDAFDLVRLVTELCRGQVPTCPETVEALRDGSVMWGFPQVAISEPRTHDHLPPSTRGGNQV